jgi:hypothetical protein
VWSNSQRPRAPDAHALHPVEEPGKQEHAIDADVGDERRSVVLDPGAIDTTLWCRPPHRIAATEPHAKLDLIERVFLNGRPGSDLLAQELDAGPATHIANCLTRAAIGHIA